MISMTIRITMIITLLITEIVTIYDIDTKIIITNCDSTIYDNNNI